jgi:hypothetical protein
VAHACNTSYLEDGELEDQDSSKKLINAGGIVKRITD